MEKGYKINTPIPFMNHMLEQISKHSFIDLVVKCSGDVEIDAHHTIEDLVALDSCKRCYIK